MIQVGIVDPHEIMRKGLGQLIEKAAGMRIVGDADCITDLLAQVDTVRMDLMVLEPVITWGSNLSLIHSMEREHKNVRILVFSEFTDIENVQSALRAGVKGIISKRAKLDEFLYGIQHVARGEPFLCAEVTAKLTAFIVHSFSKKPHELLSNRELQIFLSLVNGKTIAAVAEELSLSAKTISTHKTRIMQKMNLRTFSQLVQYASTYGLITTDAGGHQ